MAPEAELHPSADQPALSRKGQQIIDSLEAKWILAVEQRQRDARENVGHIDRPVHHFFPTLVSTLLQQLDQMTYMQPDQLAVAQETDRFISDGTEAKTILVHVAKFLKTKGDDVYRDPHEFWQTDPHDRDEAGEPTTTGTSVRMGGLILAKKLGSDNQAWDPFTESEDHG